MVDRKTLHKRNDIKVLLYHDIVPDGQPEIFRNSVRQHAFRTQMEYLDKWGFTTITFEDYRLYVSGELDELPKKPIIITFDGARKSTYDIAFPLLEALGMKAVVFVFGDMANMKEGMSGRFSEQLDLLNGPQILELHSCGYEIGSQALHDQRLTDVSSQEAWEGISRSRMLLEILLNSQVRTIAYPFGSTNEELKKMARDAGYTAGLANFTGPPVFGHDLYEIRRVQVSDSTNPFVFWLQLQPLYLFAHWVLWTVKRAFLRSDSHKGRFQVIDRIPVSKELMKS